MSIHHFVVTFDTENANNPFSLDDSEVWFYDGSVYLPESEEWVENCDDQNLETISENAENVLEKTLKTLNKTYKKNGKKIQ